MNIAVDILKKSGLTCDGTLCYLECIPDTFLSNLNEILFSKETDINAFCKALKSIWDTYNYFSCYYGVLESKFSDSAISLPSAMHLLLSIVPLQEYIVPIVTEEMVKYHISVGRDSITSQTIPHLVVCQFRWLSELKDGTSLINSLMEAIRELDDEVISDVIILFPDIFDYRDHDRLAQELKVLLSSNPSICGVIYHVLGCLSLSVILQSEIHSEGLSMLRNIPIKDAHLIIRFILNNISNVIGDRESTVIRIRERLIKDHEGYKNGPMRDDDCLTVGLRKNWEVIEQSIKFVKCLPCLVFDFLINLKWDQITNVDWSFILILNTVVDHPKILKLLTSFYIAETTPTSWRGFRKDYAYVLLKYGDSLLNIFESLLKTSNAFVKELARNLIVSSFSLLSKPIKEKTMHKLISLINSKDQNISIFATSILHILVRQEGIVMLEYMNDLMKLLKTADRIRNINHKTLFEIVLHLKLLSPGSNIMGSIEDIKIIVDHFVESEDVESQSVGVIGFIAIVESICKHNYNQRMLLNDEKFPEISSLMMIFRSNFMNIQSKIKLYRAFTDFITLGQFGEDFIASCSSHFLSLIQEDFIKPLEKNISLISLFDEYNSKNCVNISKYVFDHLSRGAYDSICSAPYALHILCSLYASRKALHLKSIILDIIQTPLFVNFENVSDISVKILLYLYALAWSCQVINASHSLEYTNTNIYNIFEKIYLIFAEFSFIFQGYFSYNFWSGNQQSKLRNQKRKKSAKTSKRKPGKKSKVEIESEAEQPDPHSENVNEDKENIPTVVIAPSFSAVSYANPSHIISLSWEVTSVLFENLVENTNKISHAFFLLSFLRYKIEDIVNVHDHTTSKEDKLRNISQPIKLFPVLLKFFHTVKACDSDSAIYDENDLSESFTSIRFLTIKYFLHLFKCLSACKLNASQILSILELTRVSELLDGIPSIESLYHFFVKETKSTDCLFSCLYLIQIIINIFSWCNDITDREELVELFQFVYRKKWSVSLHQSKNISSFYSQSMSDLFLLLPQSPSLAIMDAMVRTDMSGLILTISDPPPLESPLLNKDTFIIFSKMAFNCISHLLNSIACEDLQFNDLSLILKIYIVLFSSIKVYDHRDMIKLTIKNGTNIIKIFSKKYLPIFDKIFKTERANIQTILRQFQQCTRLLQHICRHAKINKDGSLMISVPNLKKSLELFIYRVKLMLEKNSCSSAFWLGTLKNRDIYGQEVVTQMPTTQD